MVSKSGKSRLRVAVLYGGRSGEHEVSLQSAASVIRNLDHEKFEIVPIGIDKQGRWHLNDLRLIEESQKGSKALPIFKDAPTVVLPPNPNADGTSLVPLSSSNGPAAGIDVIFPVMHGTYCEDGSIQGLLELADVAYVGCGVLASAVGMDKDVAKRLARDAGLPIVPFVTIKEENWLRGSEEVREQVARQLGFPVFVKPSNSGSSLGVHKVKEASAFEAAVQDSFKYDRKVLVERAVAAREIEVSVLQNPDPTGLPLVSIAGEINPTHEFYSYEAKYLDENGADLKIPADITPEQQEIAQKLGRDIFLALDCEGMARVDMFLDKNTGVFYFNEINTLPGFTQISMYPKLWEASGLSYRDLLTKLIELAMQRQEKKSKLAREYVP